jgi:hypothetical protein
MTYDLKFGIPSPVQDDGRTEQGARADALAGTGEGTGPAEFLGLKAGLALAPWPRRKP